MQPVPRPDAQRTSQIDEVLAALVKPARWPERAEVEITANHLHGEPVPWAEAVAGSFEPFAEGDAWGKNSAPNTSEAAVA